MGPMPLPNNSSNNNSNNNLNNLNNSSNNNNMTTDRIMQRRSILSFPGRQMSITSENTFGRAMSGLSALSIDWENMEDFDVNVDHSAHVNNDMNMSIGSGFNTTSNNNGNR